jgi:serine protease Do
VQAGDVIVGVGSQRVKTLDELRKLVEKSGKTVALLIERDGRQIYVPIRVG